jgi:Arc/MetJ family transcription regulator
MTKRQIDIDDDLLDQVRTVLGTKTIKETVNAALAEIAQYPARLAILENWLDDPYRDTRELKMLEKAMRRDLDSWSTVARSAGLISSPYEPSSGACSRSDVSPPVP